VRCVFRACAIVGSIKLFVQPVKAWMHCWWIRLLCGIHGEGGFKWVHVAEC
jgi:hypothetical protein